jgi:hypothetical protein
MNKIKISDFLSFFYLLLFLLMAILLRSCTNSTSGAFEYNSTSYFINDKFHNEIPDSLIRQSYGFLITDMYNKDHSYKKFKQLTHRSKNILFCTAHRKWEVITAYWQSEKQVHEYEVNTHRKR